MNSAGTYLIRALRPTYRRTLVVLALLGATVLVLTLFQFPHHGPTISAWTNIRGRNSLRPLQHDASDAYASKEASGTESCTMHDIERKQGKMILTTINAAFIDFTDNLLESIRRTRACPNITIAAEDDESFHYYSEKTNTYPGLNVIKTGSGEQHALTYGTEEFNYFVHKRLRYILFYLQSGLEVLFTDADTFWFRDPYPYFEGDFDLAAEKGTRDVFCSGLVYFKPTSNSQDFVREWIRSMEVDNAKNRTNQQMMNILIRQKAIPTLRVKVLDSANFPRGKLFFDSEWRRNKNEIVVVHNNGIKGHDKKVRRFETCGMWLIHGGIGPKSVCD